nr:hypothetical protein [Tanacetum cinerariifolium]
MCAMIPTCCDDDDDDSTITPNEPVDSLIMGDEYLNTILATESDEFIKSCVGNLVPNPSESEDESECDMPTQKKNLNPLFEEEIIPIKIDQHHNNAKSTHDSSIIPSSSKIDSVLDEFAGELTILKSIPLGINKTDCDPRDEIHLTNRLLYDNSSPRPSEEFVSKNSNANIESFFPSPIPNEDSDSLMEEIDLFLTSDDPMPPNNEEDVYDSERDILISQVPSFQTLPSFPQQYPCCEDCGVLPEADHSRNIPSIILSSSLIMTFLQEEKRIEEEQAAKAQNSKIPVCYDDDDDYDSAITPNEPIDSLSMGDDHLDTIPAMESDEFIKSCVENLVPNPSESEGEYECDVPAGFITFSNVLFDADYNFDSGDDQSFFDEDFSKKIHSNPLFDEEIIPMKIDQHHFNAESDLIESLRIHDSSIIPSLKIDSLLDEFASELTLLKSILPGIDETDCRPEEETHFTKRLLYDNSYPRPPEEIVYSNADIESFSPSPIPVEDSDSRMEEIDLSFNLDDPMPPSIGDDDHDSERDIPILEKLLDNYSLSLPKNESCHFDIHSPYRPPAKPPDGNTGTLNIKMMGDVSEQKVPIPGLMITRVSNQEKSPDLLSHQGLEIF